jgi:hypothetical protein
VYENNIDFDCLRLLFSFVDVKMVFSLLLYMYSLGLSCIVWIYYLVVSGICMNV